MKPSITQYTFDCSSQTCPIPLYNDCVNSGEEKWTVAVPPVPPQTSESVSAPVSCHIALERLTKLSQVETNG